ncbi:DUF2937 family protein [Marinovum sp.]|uniref:DUF2937 family protein n=1 Tax=Marinovum sp. TaxID=2024839 RepID=UPI002B27BDA3|nr:DUF2937 family protein [Marinovum sp.]
MLAKALSLAGGITGAVGLSQFPEFSQQYAQRLGGAVDELSRMVSEFEADAAAVGLSPAEALSQLSRGESLARARSVTMAATIERHDRLSADLAALEGAGPFTRAYFATRMTDSTIAERAWQAYKPAVPATFEGVTFAGVGYLTGLLVVGALLSLLRRLFGRRQRAAA